MIKPKLLIVDDERANLRLLERLFTKDYECFTAASGAEAIQLLEKHDFAIIITDQRMPGMCGTELLKQTSELRPHIARILLTGYTDVQALSEAINGGLVDMYLTKPWNNDDLQQRVTKALDQYRNNKKHHALKDENERLQQKLGEMKSGFANALSELFRYEDEYLHEHAFRVQQYATKLATAMELSDEDREDIALAASIHDIGSSQHENGQSANSGLQTHNERLGRILAMIPGMKNSADIIRFYCENFDGSGYPHKLSGDQIPLASKILRVADEYDHLTQPRDKSTSIDDFKALESLRIRTISDFDPRVVSALELLLANEMAVAKIA